MAVDHEVNAVGESDYHVNVQQDGSYEVSMMIDSDISAEVGSDGVNVGGTWDYEELDNLPTIEDVPLVGSKNLSDFGMGTVTNAKILDLFK